MARRIVDQQGTTDSYYNERRRRVARAIYDSYMYSRLGATRRSA